MLTSDEKGPIPSIGSERTRTSETLILDNDTYLITLLDDQLKYNEINDHRRLVSIVRCWFSSVKQCNYTNIQLYVKTSGKLPGLIRDKWCQMCAPSDIATASVIGQLCLQREGRLMTVLEPQEVDEFLEHICTK